MPVDKKLRDLASSTIRQHEGDVSKVYKDIKNIPSVGVGLNLDSPAVKALIYGEGYNPEDIISGTVQLPPETLDKVHNEMLSRSLEAVKKDFGDYGLSENELAALTSLHYNSPSLLGPNLRKAIQKGDKTEAAKEIMLRSNKEKNRGLAKRRLEEAKLFGGGQLPDLSPEETMDLRGYWQEAPDTAEKRKLYTDYPFLNPEQVQSGYPFFKIKKNLYGPMKNPYEISKSVPEIAVPPVGNFGDQFSSPEDKPIPEVTDVTNILDQFDLLKRFK